LEKQSDFEEEIRITMRKRRNLRRGGEKVIGI
jgi:hypothetical protein